MINIYQGETVNVEINVVDKEGVDVSLSGAEAIFSFRAVDSVEVTSKGCTINGSKINVTMTPSETTDMLGAYQYEVKLKDYNGDIDMILADRINVEMSIIPEQYI